MAASDLEKLVRPGDVLAGKYQVERIIGHGGMGVVVAALHLQLDERVAIKFLLPDALNRADLLARFEREARAAVKIKSEHVAHVIDVGVLDTGSPYIVMEYLEGVDLAARLEASGPVAVGETTDFVLQACEAIVEAHALGIVHRDLKPANLFIIRGADGLQSIKVLDFGISKASTLGGSSPGMTQTQSMLGSPFYMSPEQMASAKSVDFRTDIWSLGVILYQCVTGVMPFQAETLPELVLKIVTQPLPPLSSVRPDIPPAFAQVVTRCLEKDRDRRYRHVGELAQALVPFSPERGRVSAEHIMRVVTTSGMAMAMTPAMPPVSSPEFPAQPIARTQQLPPSSQQQPHVPPPVSGPVSHRQTTPIGPPPGTPPPGHHPVPNVPSAPPPVFGVTNNAFGKTDGRTRPPPTSDVTKLLVGGAIAVFLLLVLGGGLFLGKTIVQRREAQAKSVPSASVSALASVVPAASSAPVAVLTPVTASAAPPPLDDASTPDAGASKIPNPIPPNPSTTASPIGSPLPAATKPSCKPPYFIDAKGNHVFKPECT